ncbi:MAG: DUF4493 domain-containing protein [Muribaculaceae bacterium]|nr:DUF4493 domain-containing protein [Muribaculaceae bacterium]
MKLTFKNVALGLAVLGLTSCANEAPWGSGSRGKGAIDLKLTADLDVKDALPMVRAGAPELTAPDVANFAIEMRNLDTDMVQTWTSLEKFNDEEGFDVGSYTLTAFYGNPNECGFDKPYFKGEASLNVLEGRETEVEVTAQLANVMLSVDYTDAFKEYFRDYSVTAHTDGHANVVFGKSETRAGFLTAGDVTLQVKLTNPSGKTVTLTPAQFPAVARHHYHVTFDVDADPVGGAALNVIFDDSLTKENVTISLSDELYNADAPVVGSEGFTTGQTVEALSGNPSATPLKFETICKGGIKSAILKIAQISGSESYSPSFDKELDLIQADESTQYALEQNGIKVAGLFKNPEQMAIVDVTELPKYLPEGTYEITLTVTDNLDRNNENPVTLNLSTLPIHIEVTGGSALYEYSDPANVNSTNPTVEATVSVTYNGFNPETAISFKNRCSRQGIFKDCDIVEVHESTETRGFPDKNYIFTIKVCDVETSPLPMELWFNGTKYADFSLDIIEPKFSLIADPFATYSRFKVLPENADDLTTIVEGLTLYKNGSAVVNIDKDVKNGILTMDGLDQDTDYTIGYSLTTRPDGIPESQTIQIHTETASQIPNGDFSQKERTIDWNPITAGGQYKYGATNMWNQSSIEIDTPKGWATLNPITCWRNAKVQNTWFCVPSTLMEGNSVVVRSVAYDHDGKLPAVDDHGLSVRAKYSRNKPSSFANKASGELFLGSYAYDGSDHRVDGIEFASRPASITFNYSYAPISGEVGLMYIAVVGDDGNILAESRADIKTATNKEMTVSLPTYPFGKKPSLLRLSFKSSKTVIDVPVPDNIQDVTNTTGLSGQTISANQYKSLCVGSKLTLTNIELNY